MTHAPQTTTKGIPPHRLPTSHTSRLHFTCINCGYDVYGVPAVKLHRCPECGRRPNSSYPGRRAAIRWALRGVALVALVSLGTYYVSWWTSEYRPLRRVWRAGPAASSNLALRCQTEARATAGTAGAIAAGAWLVWGYLHLVNRTRTRRLWWQMRREISAAIPWRTKRRWLLYAVPLAACLAVGGGIVLFAGREILAEFYAVAMARWWVALTPGGDSPASAAEAVKWYARAADLGDPSAMTKLAAAYAAGRGISRDDRLAASWYRKAAEQGDPIAMVKLGELYTAGLGVSQNDLEAIAWYERAAELDEPAAWAKLGEAFASGRGGRRDLGRAVEWYEKAAAQGDAAAMVGAGDCIAASLRGPSVHLGRLPWAYAAGHVGNSSPFVPTRMRVRTASGIEREMWIAPAAVRALGWYHKAAEAGNTGALHRIGDLFAEGHAVPQSDGEAAEWYRKAASAGNTRAMLTLAKMLFEGRAAPRVPGEALQWYEKAANAGDVKAMLGLGTMYFEGRAVPPDPAAARAWLTRAAESGSEEARQLVTTLDFRGAASE